MITTEKDGYVRCGCRSAGECNHNLFPEEIALEKMVNAFAKEMLAKLIRKKRQGYHGWDNPELKGKMRELLIQHLERGDDQMVDVANFAAMIWNISQSPNARG